MTICICIVFCVQNIRQILFRIWHQILFWIQRCQVDHFLLSWQSSAELTFAELNQHKRCLPPLGLEPGSLGAAADDLSSMPRRPTTFRKCLTLKTICSCLIVGLKVYGCFLWVPKNVVKHWTEIFCRLLPYSQTWSAQISKY